MTCQRFNVAKLFMDKQGTKKMSLGLEIEKCIIRQMNFFVPKSFRIFLE